MYPRGTCFLYVPSFYSYFSVFSRSIPPFFPLFYPFVPLKWNTERFIFSQIGCLKLTLWRWKCTLSELCVCLCLPFLSQTSCFYRWDVLVDEKKGIFSLSTFTWLLIIISWLLRTCAKGTTLSRPNFSPPESQTPLIFHFSYWNKATPLRQCASSSAPWFH